MYTKQVIGKFGEDTSCRYLIKNNYKIIKRNFRCRQGEIDIIAYDLTNKEVVFLEVKTRTDFDFGFPSEAVTATKQKHIINSAKYFLYCNKMENIYVRFDVIEVVVDVNHNKYKLNHFKNII